MTWPLRSITRRTITGSIGLPLRAKTANARVMSSMCTHEAPSASDEQNSFSHFGLVTSGVVMPSRCDHFSTSLVPRMWKISTDGGFFDHTSARSSDTDAL